MPIRRRFKFAKFASLSLRCIAAILVGLGALAGSTARADVASEHASLADQLLDPDPRQRRSAERQLNELGEAARPLLEKLAGGELTLASHAKVLLLRLDLGVDRLSPLLATGDRRAGLISAAIAARDPYATLRERQRAMRLLTNDGEVAAPLIANLIVDVVNPADDAEPIAVSRPFHELYNNDAGTWAFMTPARSAVLAELFTREAGPSEAASFMTRTTRRSDELAREFADIALASWVNDGLIPASMIAQREQAQAALQLIKTGDAPSLDGNPDDRLLRRAAHAMATGEVASATSILSDLEDATTKAGASFVLASLAGDDPAIEAAQERIKTLLEAYEPPDANSKAVQQHAVLAVLIDDQEAAGDLLQDRDGLSRAGLLWQMGRYAELRDFAGVALRDRGEGRPGAARPPHNEVQEYWRRLSSQYFSPNSRQYTDESAGFNQYLQQRVAAAAGDRTAYTFLHHLEPGSLAWRWILAEAGEQRDLILAAAASDPDRLTDLAEQLLEAGEREAAIAVARKAAILAAARPASRILSLGSARRIANQAGDLEATRQLAASSLLLLLSDHAREAHVERYRSAYTAATIYPVPMAADLAITLTSTRARQAIARGDTATAVRLHDTTAATRPSDLEVSIVLIRHLDAIGETRQASTVFGQRFEVLRQLADTWPRSPFVANQAAWLAARSNRATETALQLAQRAVNNAPYRDAYVDTLAEVHAVRGETDEAMDAMRRTLSIASPQSLPLYVTRYLEVKAALEGDVEADADQNDPS